MRIVTAVLSATLLLAGCTGSSDDSSGPEPTASPSDVSRSSDEDALRQQAEQQAEQLEKAQDQLAKEVNDKADDLTSATVKIVIAGGRATPQGDRVEAKVGQVVRLVITSDVAEQIHVHSDPEHTYDVAAGETVTESFTIDTPGQVAVEAHELGVTIVQLVVR